MPAELCSLSLSGAEQFLIVNNSFLENFFDLSYFSLQPLPHFSFPLEQNSLKELDILFASNFFLVYPESTFIPLTPLELALPGPSVSSLLNPVVNCQSSTNMNYQQHLTQLISPLLLETFFQSSRIPHRGFLPLSWAAPYSTLPVLPHLSSSA